MLYWIVAFVIMFLIATAIGLPIMVLVSYLQSRSIWKRLDEIHVENARDFKQRLNAMPIRVHGECLLDHADYGPFVNTEGPWSNPSCDYRVCRAMYDVCLTAATCSFRNDDLKRTIQEARAYRDKRK